MSYELRQKQLILNNTPLGCETENVKNDNKLRVNLLSVNSYLRTNTKMRQFVFLKLVEAGL